MLAVFGFTASPSYAGTFFDNFDDGNADGWWLGNSHHTRWIWGNWRVVDGTLVQDIGADAVIALVQNLPVSNQSIETQLKTNEPSGGCGVTIWYHDIDNYILVAVSPAIGRIAVGEYINNVEAGSYYQNVSLQNGRWYNLRVDANSVKGELAVYLDNVYLFTYVASTQYRLGLSGVFTGNAGGYFDNFRLTSNDIPPINITIDIRPWNKRNPIQYKGHGILPVAILSTEKFDAINQVDQKSLTFGTTGDEQSLAFCNRRPKNIRRDGSKDDLICYFFINVAHFQCGNTAGILKGKTVDGIPIEGKDLIKVNQCK